MIEVNDLCKYFGSRLAVDSVSFRVEAGKTLVLLGTSGSGKTTTMKMLNRLIEPSSGSVRIQGQDIRQMPPEMLRRQMGYVIQSIGLFPHYTVAQNIALVPQLLRWPSRKIEERCRELLSMLGLPQEVARLYPKQLSGGQQQRVGLARALAADPPLVLLDEPFGALDPITKRQIQQEFEQMDTLRHKTMVMVTHDVFEGIVLGDAIALMDQGKIQQLGTPKELLFAPANDFVKRFFDTQRFRLELQVIRLQDILTILQSADADQNIVAENHLTIHASLDQSLLNILEDLEKAEAVFVRPFTRDADSEPATWQPIHREALLQAFYVVKDRLKQ